MVKVAAFLLTLAVIASCGDDSSDSASTGVTSPVSASDAAHDYCNSSGGEAHTARPYWNTNADRPDWSALAGSVELCRFDSDEENAEERSSIFVDLDTLYSTDPTLAGVAYLSKVPPTLPKQPSANPANANCTALGGSSQFGTNVNGGGWVTDDRPTDVIDLCVFPDLSFVDEFGILYYSQGTVRGADLSTVMRFDESKLPQIFG
jgi:putative hemolysin